MAGEKILIVEDDLAFLRLLKEGLQAERYQVSTARDVFQARIEVKRAPPALMLLDVGLPDESGLDLCRELRAEPRTASLPILFVTGKKSLADKVLGLKLGGDDYLTKPFELPELLARVEALLRRSKGAGGAAESLAEGELRVDLAAHQAYLKGKPLKLWPKEFLLLEAFLRARNRMLTRQHLYEAVWRVPYDGNTRQVDFLVHRLRQRLGPYEDRIVGVRGLGYRFESR
ncbi:MAG: response regulator transcription factor [Elusimicrobia bacterium]|nr:response regulator transcription factor [Elusimicrobiota bacterium]